MPYKLKCHQISADQKQLKIHFYIFTNFCIIALALNYLQLKKHLEISSLLYKCTWPIVPRGHCLRVSSIHLALTASSSCCRAMKRIYLLKTQNLWATEPFISTSGLGSSLSCANYASQVLSLRLSLCS